MNPHAFWLTQFVHPKSWYLFLSLAFEVKEVYLNFLNMKRKLKGFRRWMDNIFQKNNWDIDKCPHPPLRVCRDFHFNKIAKLTCLQFTSLEKVNHYTPHKRRWAWRKPPLSWGGGPLQTLNFQSCSINGFR